MTLDFLPVLYAVQRFAGGVIALARLPDSLVDILIEDLYSNFKQKLFMLTRLLVASIVISKTGAISHAKEIQSLSKPSDALSLSSRPSR